MNSIVVKLNLPVRICSEVVPVLMGVGTLRKSIISWGRTPEYVAFDILFPLCCFFIWYIMHFSLFKYSRTVIDEFCIRQELIIKIGSRIIYERIKEITWSNVDIFERAFAGYWSGYRIWGKSNLGYNSLIVLNTGVSTFNEDARRYIENHIPENKVSESARKKIKKSNLFSYS